MNLKIIIIALIIIIGGYFFADELMTLFPQTSEVVNSINEDFDDIKKNTIDGVNTKLNDTLTGAGNKINDIKNSSKTIISDELQENNPIPKISKDISETITNSTSTITEIFTKP